jgi:predicted 3-demethylubiquinone-9 3-methyltransferase (glyoxalase superfamily)
MNNHIHPCLWFDGKAKEAADFYCSFFKNSKITTDTPMVVIFELNGKKFMGLNGGPMFKINPSISIFVLCESINETNELWNKLMEGGKVLMPIDKYPWSERYGWVQDKFGLTWQVSVVYREGDKQAITPSMLFTGGQFGKAEEAIKLYTSVFNNSSKDIMIHHYPDKDPNAGKVMFSEFKLNEYPLIAMDGPGEHGYTFNEAVSIVVECETQEEIDFFWNKLTADGGQESMCGWLKDKFGVSWQIIPSIIGKVMTDPEKGSRAMQALMKMKKIDIESLVNA